MIRRDETVNVPEVEEVAKRDGYAKPTSARTGAGCVIGAQMEPG